jgi:hypothetical protein
MAEKKDFLGNSAPAQLVPDGATAEHGEVIDSLISLREVDTGKILIRKENTRSGLALFLVLGLLLMVVGSFTGVYLGLWPETKELLQAIFPAFVALVASTVGYYFGSRK